jgi:hypothetical protein
MKLAAIKGSELRKDACEGGRNVKRHRKIYISKILKICETIDAKLTGRIWIKGVGQPINTTTIKLAHNEKGRPESRLVAGLVDSRPRGPR